MRIIYAVNATRDMMQVGRGSYGTTEATNQRRRRGKPPAWTVGDELEYNCGRTTNLT